MHLDCGEGTITALRLLKVSDRMNNLNVFLCFSCRYKTRWMYLDHLLLVHAPIITFVVKVRYKMRLFCIHCYYFLHMLQNRHVHTQGRSWEGTSLYSRSSKRLCTHASPTHDLKMKSDFCVFRALRRIRNTLRLRGENATNGEVLPMNSAETLSWSEEWPMEKINEIIQSSGEEATEAWKRARCHIQ